MNRYYVNSRSLIRAYCFSSLVVGLFLLPGAVVFAEELSGEADSAADHSTGDQGDESKQGQALSREKILQRITVTGSQEKAKKVPGSAHLLEGNDLEETKVGFDDIHRMLRRVPGVNIQEEDGYGLRPNISFRGNPSERTDSITLMEDGVLIAPAPYSAPAAYYFPTAGRMEGMEVIKGAGSIKYGPRTTGGSLNMLSTSIPDDFKLRGTVGVGSNDTKKMHFNTGDSYRYGGFMLETYQIETSGFRRLDGGGDTGFDLQDYVGKFRINSDRDKPFYQQLEVKLGYYKQGSNETYLGLTQEDFDNDPYRRYAASQLDRIEVDHYQTQAQHYIELSDSIDITTTGYYNRTSRAWYKLDSVGGTGLASILSDPGQYADQYDWITGGTSPDDAMSVRDNNRDYYSAGIQTVVSAEITTGPLEHGLQVGGRYHRDEEDRFQRDDRYRMDNGRLVMTRAGAPGSQANRVGTAEALAFYMIDDIKVGDLTVSPGFRYETINFRQRDYGRNDPTRSGDNESVHRSGVSAFIPGIGVSYDLTSEFTGFAGVHKGFSPPGPSNLQGVKEEESINYEVGAKYGYRSFLSQLVFFYTDYDNLLGQDSLASGGVGTGDLFNLGEARAYGIEFSTEYDIADIFDLPFSMPVFGNYTYTNAKLSSSFDSDFFGEVNKGDWIPYIPEHQFAVGTAVQHEKWGKLGIRAHFVNAMHTAGGTAQLGDAPKTDSYLIFDASAETPDLYKGARFYVDALNLFDREYAVALRPSGFRPGMPFTVIAGIRFAM